MRKDRKFRLNEKMERWLLVLEGLLQHSVVKGVWKENSTRDFYLAIYATYFCKDLCEIWNHLSIVTFSWKLVLLVKNQFFMQTFQVAEEKCNIRKYIAFIAKYPFLNTLQLKMKFQRDLKLQFALESFFLFFLFKCSISLEEIAL